MIRYFKKGISEFWARVTLLSIELMLVFAAFFASLFTFIFIARMIFFEKKETFDSRVFMLLEQKVNNINTNLMQVFSFFGSHYFLIPANILLAAYYFLVKKQRWYSIKIPVISLSSLIVMFVLKQFFHRERPMVPLLEEAKGLSFPSGHALMSFAFYGLIIFLVQQSVKNKLYRGVLILMLSFLIFFIGLSRIYLRVHYASDVIAGFCLGFIWLIFSLGILNRLEKMNFEAVKLPVDKPEIQS